MPLRRHLLLGAAALVGRPACGQAMKIRLGTATPGGGFPVYGAAFVEGVRRIDPDLEIEAINTKGSTENVPLLEEGKLDIALVQGEVAMEALEGIGRTKTKLVILTAMYTTAGMFAVRADSPARTIADLEGKRVVFGARGSGLGILARYVLDGVGLDRDKDFEAVYLDRAGDGPAMVISGEAAALWGGGRGWPSFTAVANAPGGSRFIVPDGAEIARIQQKYPFLKKLTVPEGTFPGQKEALVSVGSWSFVLARPDLDEGVAYKLARALHMGEAQLKAKLTQAEETTARNTIAATNGQGLHPGVLRYYRDAGLLPK